MEVVILDTFEEVTAALRPKLAKIVGASVFALEGAIKGNIRAVDAIDTGYMLNTVGVDFIRGDLEAEVNTYAEYWEHVNYGTASVAPRPFVEPAVDEVQARVDTALSQLFRDAP